MDHRLFILYIIRPFIHFVKAGDLTFEILKLFLKPFGRRRIKGRPYRLDTLFPDLIIEKPGKSDLCVPGPFIGLVDQETAQVNGNQPVAVFLLDDKGILGKPIKGIYQKRYFYPVPGIDLLFGFQCMDKAVLRHDHPLEIYFQTLYYS